MAQRMTRAQFDEIVRAKGPQWANNWRIANQVEVEDMGAMVPTGSPLAAPAAELPPIAPQGGLAAAEPSIAPQPAASPQEMPSPMGALPSLQDWYGEQVRYNRELESKQNAVNSRRADYYRQAEEELKQRRFGPSRSEQLFQLAAAIAKPTYDRSFGSVLANVTPALAEMAKANRAAEEERSLAAQKLREEALTSGENSELAMLALRQKNAAAMGPVITAAEKAKAPPKVRTGFNPVTGELVNMDTGEKIEEQGIRTLTPQQAAELSRNPANRGKRFRTTDGRIMEIK